MAVRCSLNLPRFVLTLAALGGLAITGLQSAVAAPKLAVYRGNGHPERIGAFSTWLGCSVPVIQDNIRHQQGWNAIALATPWDRRVATVAQDYAASVPGGAVVFSTAIVPDRSHTLEAGARGEYDEHWRRLARNLVAVGVTRATFRLGYEFDGDWFDWGTGGQLPKARAFATYWRRIVGAMRAAAPGAAWSFDWNPTENAFENPGLLEAAWPGDGYVDFVGTDVYDRMWPAVARSNFPARWAVTERKLRAAVAFARARGKPLSIPEWAVWNDPADAGGGVDNPYFIERMHAFISDPANGVTYATYFEFLNKHALSVGGLNPRAAAKFKELFGGACRSGPPLAIGLGAAGGGFVEVVRPREEFAHAAWPRVSWAGYGQAGETRPAWCDLDGDGRHELVLGLGPVPANGGWLEVKDDAQAGFAQLTWLRINWPQYNAANGETWPACGDIDGDGRDEIVVGLGRGGDGWAMVLDDAVAGYAPHPATPGGDGWLRLGWTAYNAGVGAIRPAVGNLDDDAAEEIVLGLGPGGAGSVQLLDDAAAGFAPLAGTPSAGGWLRLGWGAYEAANGETWPAVCDLDGDGWSEVVLGLGAGGRGYFRVFDSAYWYAPATGTPNGDGWGQLNWREYNDQVGAVFPGCGDLDGDGADELVLGLDGPAGSGGWLEVREDLLGGLVNASWARVNWADYRSAGGPARPTVAR